MIKDIVFSDSPDFSQVDFPFAEFRHVDSCAEIAADLGLRRSFAIVTADPDKFRGIHSNSVVDIRNIRRESVIKSVNWVLSDFGKDRPMTDNTWFTSDQHFWHKNIIRYCSRPWNSGKDADGNLVISDEDVVRMNEALIMGWNSVVGKDDIVWMLGDFAFGDKSRIPEIVSRLNGRINLVLGNHDMQKIGFYYDAGFNRVYDKPVILNRFIMLSHTPFEFVPDGFVNIFGHVHSNSIYQTWSRNGVCACVERHEYKPVSWKDIRLKMAELRPDDFGIG